MHEPVTRHEPHDRARRIKNSQQYARTQAEACAKLTDDLGNFEARLFPVQLMDIQRVAQMVTQQHVDIQTAMETLAVTGITAETVQQYMDIVAQSN